MTTPRKVIIEADGGSRGNPGPAAYGALVRDADTGRLLAEAAEPLGTATNNVAEYRGLLAGLRLARECAAGAELEVRMDSKLVIEQMAGRWKIKHPDLRPLAAEARRLVPPGVTWTWVPRERNKAADGLLNKVLDGGPGVWRIGPAAAESAADSTVEYAAESGVESGVGSGESGAESAVDAAVADTGPRGGSPTILRLYALPTGSALAADAAEPTERLDSADTLAAARSSRDRLLRSYAGTTTTITADPRTIALLTALALGGTASIADRLEVAPGSVTELVWYADGRAALRALSGPLP